jgi:hypothetical protein
MPPFAFPAGPFIPKTFLGGVYLPGNFLGFFQPTIVPYVPASPTGWKSTGVRMGPDPSSSTGIRMKGLG